MLENARIDLKRLGEKVRFLRQGKGWTLSDLAAKSGVSKAYISDLENAAAGKPNVQYMFAIAVALEVTLDDLLRNATHKEVQRRRSHDELPPGLRELQLEMQLSDDDVDTLAQVNFRGTRPKDKEGWRFLLEAIKMVGQRPPEK